MKRIEKIRSMTTEEMAKEIIRLNITDEYCDCGCPDTWDEPICQDELGCCIRWLEEDVGDDR